VISQGSYGEEGYRPVNSACMGQLAVAPNISHLLLEGRVGLCLLGQRSAST
jgi:hypothetical protein